MKLDLTPRVEAVIRQMMATGQYASEADALEAALDQLIDPDTGLEVGEIGAELQKGLDDIAAGRTVSAVQVYAELAETIRAHAKDGR